MTAIDDENDSLFRCFLSGLYLIASQLRSVLVLVHTAHSDTDCVLGFETRKRLAVQCRDVRRDESTDFPVRHGLGIGND